MGGRPGGQGFPRRVPPLAGVSPVPGLYCVGRSWQWTRGSALFAGVGDDASYVASQVAEQLSGRTTGEGVNEHDRSGPVRDARAPRIKEKLVAALSLWDS